MHYGEPDGSHFNGCYIKPKQTVDCTITFLLDNFIVQRHFDNVGQVVGLSPLDKETIRRRYSCRGTL